MATRKELCRVSQFTNHCGAQSLAYILSLYAGRRISQRAVAAKGGARISIWFWGMNPDKLARAARRYGHTARPRKYTWDERLQWLIDTRKHLKEGGMVLLSVDYCCGFCGHWVALVGITSTRRYIVADPYRAPSCRFVYLEEKDFIPYSFNECGEDEDREGEPDQFYGLFVS